MTIKLNLIHRLGSLTNGFGMILIIRYNNNGVASANKAPEENVGSCSPGDSSVAKIMGSGLSSIDNPSNQQSSGSERATQREAALMKFRLKRKERCFEKKVRYHSRRKLAEQRPRVKGQFIRKRDDSNQEMSVRRLTTAESTKMV
ncbi:hypothetical protein IGI04_005260 [Brassica rapa subsp. trilocularis]|uniref:CCT domain-containing protein n=1 Tax=Brassica rapa subsp. trilocularis TaxID=1813537 RepID=A0ABQ7NF79_BRACM|nr:hypothetical protein IGI04_005260 [Brassica rapa subsp. trilocularis]